MISLLLTMFTMTSDGVIGWGSGELDQYGTVFNHGALSMLNLGFAWFGQMQNLVIVLIILGLVVGFIFRLKH